jgi:hypothetical protein
MPGKTRKRNITLEEREKLLSLFVTENAHLWTHAEMISLTRQIFQDTPTYLAELSVDCIRNQFKTYKLFVTLSKRIGKLYHVATTKILAQVGLVQVKEIALLALASVYQSFKCCPIQSLPDQLNGFLHRCASVVINRAAGQDSHLVWKGNDIAILGSFTEYMARSLLPAYANLWSQLYSMECNQMPATSAKADLVICNLEFWLGEMRWDWVKQGGQPYLDFIHNTYISNAVTRATPDTLYSKLRSGDCVPLYMYRLLAGDKDSFLKILFDIFEIHTYDLYAKTLPLFVQADSEYDQADSGVDETVHVGEYEKKTIYNIAGATLLNTIMSVQDENIRKLLTENLTLKSEDVLASESKHNLPIGLAVERARNENAITYVIPELLEILLEAELIMKPILMDQKLNAIMKNQLFSFARDSVLKSDVYTDLKALFKDVFLLSSVDENVAKSTVDACMRNFFDYYFKVSAAEYHRKVNTSLGSSTDEYRRLGFRAQILTGTVNAKKDKRAHAKKTKKNTSEPAKNNGTPTNENKKASAQDAGQ